MMSPALIEEIQKTIDQGDDRLDSDEFSVAISLYQQAAALIPEPKHSHDIALSAFLALGEGYFFSGWADDALVAFNEALKSPGGTVNPLLHLRMGQAYFEINELDRAADSLTRAYALDGRDIFTDEDDKYLSFLATKIEL